MNFWNNEAVAALAGARMSWVVDNDLLISNHVEVLGEFAERFARESFLIGVDVRDVQFHEAVMDGPMTFRTEVTAYWSPKTHEVEFCGGQEDGTVMRLERLDYPWRFPVHSLPVYSLMQVEPIRLVNHAIEYRMAGWSETNRRWVYGES